MNKDVISGLALLVFDAVYFRATQTIQVSMLDDAFGARGLPHILAVLLAILASIIVIRGLLSLRRVQPAVGAQVKDADHEAPLARALGLLLIAAGYIVVLPVVGYPIGLALLIGT